MYLDTKNEGPNDEKDEKDDEKDDENDKKVDDESETHLPKEPVKNPTPGVSDMVRLPDEVDHSNQKEELWEDLEPSVTGQKQEVRTRVGRTVRPPVRYGYED